MYCLTFCVLCSSDLISKVGCSKITYIEFNNFIVWIQSSSWIWEWLLLWEWLEIGNNTWAWGDVEFLLCSTWYLTHKVLSWTWDSSFKKRRHCHSFMVLNRASDVPAADWLSQTHVKNCCNFVMFGDTFFFLMVRIPLKHSSLYNK